MDLSTISGTSNPLDIEMILSTILEYVGKSSRQDLLNCRLANHTWNRKSVESLKKHGYGFALNEENFNDFMTMLKSQKFTYKKPVGLDLQLRLCNRGRGNSNEQLIAAVSKMLQYNNASKSYAVASIDFVKCRARAYVNIAKFWEMVELSSTELKHFSVHVKSIINYGPELLCPISNVYFPKLEYICHDPRYNNNQLYWMDNLVTMINSSPNLKTLKLTRGRIENTSTTWTHSITPTLMIINRIADSPRNGITQLEIPIYSVEELIIFCQLTFTQLKVLKLHQAASLNNHERFCQFLKDNCPSLKSIEVNNERNTPDGIEEQLPWKMVQLPSITHFAFYEHRPLHALPGSEFVPDIEQLMKDFGPATHQFSNVKSFTTDYEFALFLAEIFEKQQRERRVVEGGAAGFDADGINQIVHIIFPEVTQLTIKMNPVLFSPLVRESTSASLDHVFSIMFPKLENIIIVIQPRYDEGCFASEYLHNLHLQIIPTLLNLNKVKGLVMKKYFAGCFGLILTGTLEPPAISILEEVRQKLEFLQIGKRPCTRPGDVESHFGLDFMGAQRSRLREIFMTTPLTLTRIMERFPALRKLEVDDELLREESQISYQQLLEELNHLKEHFPHTDFELI